MMTVMRKENGGMNWIPVTTTARKSGAIEMARIILPLLYEDGYVDEEDVKYYNEEFEKQVENGGEIYIEGLIRIKEEE